jgi:hypothetical protein
MRTALLVKRWKLRERRNTSRYAALMYTALLAQWRKAYMQYDDTKAFEVDSSILETVYRNLYTRVSEEEAELAILMLSRQGAKDLFGAIASLFSSTGEPLTVRFIKDLMEQYYNVYILERLKDVNETTRRYIQEAIQYGIDNGFNPIEMTRYMRERARELSKMRAVKIARTEVTTAANRAQLLTHEASPFEYTKSWMPVVDGKTRDSHIEMNPRVFIDLWETFNVKDRKGGFDEMIAPGDSTAGAANVVNCRCVLLYQVKKDSNGRPIRK